MSSQGKLVLIKSNLGLKLVFTIASMSWSIGLKGPIFEQLKLF